MGAVNLNTGEVRQAQGAEASPTEEPLMTRYVSIPTEVEAVQWTGDNPDEIEAAIGADKASTTVFGDGRLHILAGVDGAQGWVPVPKGHWLLHVPGDLSDVWPMENEAFLRKYEPVADEVLDLTAGGSLGERLKRATGV